MPGSVYAAAYAFMTSILLLTLLSLLHCQPEIGRVSLLPVAYVEASAVLNVPFGLRTKSLLKPAAVNPFGSGFFLTPAAVKRLSQSNGCRLPPVFVVVLAMHVAVELERLVVDRQRRDREDPGDGDRPSCAKEGAASAPSQQSSEPLSHVVLLISVLWLPHVLVRSRLRARVHAHMHEVVRP